jgi:hypothetical protein
MPAYRIAPIAVALTLVGASVALASCGGLTDFPESCPARPGEGITSNAPQDGTTGASGTSATSNGTGSTIDPTAPPCQPVPPKKPKS